MVRRLYGTTPAKDFGPLALKTCREQFLEAGQSRQKINQNCGRIRRMFKWGVENELVPSGVLHALQAVTGLKRGRTTAPENKPVRPVPEEHKTAHHGHERATHNGPKAQWILRPTSPRRAERVRKKVPAK